MSKRPLFPLDQRGVALPMAMLALLILSALIVGFSVLGVTEPTIANNQLMVAQARSLAEAGVERAIWALNNPADPKGIPTAGAAPAPYDGSQLVLVSVAGANMGGFRVTVTNGASVAERVITAVGWVPDDTTSNPKAHQKITLIVSNPQLVYKDPPAALSVRGQLDVGPNSVIDSRADTSCGQKVGTVATDNTSIQGNVNIWGAADNNNNSNQVTDAHNGSLPPNAHDIVKKLSTGAYDQFVFTDSDIAFLRTYAKAHGAYLQGTVTFGAGNKIPNGLVFVDTVSGNNITLEGVIPATPDSDLATVTIQSNAPADPSGIFSGWIFVNGSLSVNGSFQMNGLIYAQNDLNYHGVGVGGITGAGISRNIRTAGNAVDTTVDSDLVGTTSILYNCTSAKTGGGTIPYRWGVKGGTYKELCDSCS